MASKNDIQISWRAGIGWWCPRARRGTVIRFPDTRDHPISFSQSLAGFDSDDLVSPAHCFIHFDFGKGVWTFVSSFILNNSRKGVRTSVFYRIYERSTLIFLSDVSWMEIYADFTVLRLYSVGREENKAGYKILQNKIQPGILRINSNRDCFEEISLSTTTWCNHQYYIMFVSHSK